MAACGSGPAASYEQTRSAQQMVDDASKSTGNVKSFHVAIDATTTDGPASADFDVEGASMAGKLTSQGLTVRIVHVGDRTFVYGSDLAAGLAPTNSQAAAIVKAKAADRWVLVPPEFWSTTGLTDIVDLPKLTACLKTESGLTKKGTSTISGRQVAEVDDQLAGGMFVQTAAPHYYARIDLEGVDPCITDPSVSHETIDLTKLGEKLGVKAPSDYVDLQTLAG